LLSYQRSNRSGFLAHPVHQQLRWDFLATETMRRLQA